MQSFLSKKNVILPLLWLLLIVSICIAFCTFRPIVDRPFSLDETEESFMGWRMATIGPKTFVALDRGGMGMDVSHPLLYTFSHALVQRIFGNAETVLRLYGIVQYLLSLVLMLLIIREISPYGSHRNYALIWGAILYLINPLLIQHSVVVNSDNNLLTTSILLFAYLFIRIDGRSPNIARALCALSFVFCLWVKEATPYCALLGLILYRAVSCGVKRAAADLLIVGVGGTLIFWVTWAAYCLFTGTDMLGFIKFTILGKASSAFSGHYLSVAWKSTFARARWPLYWVSAPFFIALIMFTIRRYADAWRVYKTDRIDAVIITAWALWLPFYYFRPNMDMMKYQYPAYPFFIAALAYIFAESAVVLSAETGDDGAGRLRSLLPYVIACVVIGFTWYYYRLGDYILALWGPVHGFMGGYFLAYYFMPVIFAAASGAVFARRSEHVKSVTLAMLICVVPINIGLDLNHQKADYKTVEVYLDYGERGLRDTIDYLAAHIKNGAIISVRYDIARYLTNRKCIAVEANIPPETILSSADAQKIERIISATPIEYMVFHGMMRFSPIHPAASDIVRRYYILEEKIGDFYIFKRKA